MLQQYNWCWYSSIAF